MVEKMEKKAVILLAEDNPADQMLTKRVFEEIDTVEELFIVENGLSVLRFLKNLSPFQSEKDYPRPDLLLLDINMPGMDGKEVLKEIKSSPSLKALPVVMLTTSNHEQDIVESYNLGVNAYIRKPVELDKFEQVVEALGDFWLSAAYLPPRVC